MASDVKDCKSWGILGCGWLGMSFAQAKLGKGDIVWGTTRTDLRREDLKAQGIQPVLMDLASPNSLWDAWPGWDALVIALPPGASASADQVAQIRKRMDASVWNVMVSSTSVYPSKPGIYEEGDALHRVSPHSGVDVLEVEKQWMGAKTTFLRCSGLIGPGRHLFRKGRGLLPSDRWVNVVHQVDVIRAISHVVGTRLAGPVNVSAPVHRTWNECFQQSECSQPSQHPEHRSINSGRLIESGFDFKFADPMCMPHLFPEPTP